MSPLLPSLSYLHPVLNLHSDLMALLDLLAAPGLTGSFSLCFHAGIPPNIDITIFIYSYVNLDIVPYWQLFLSGLKVLQTPSINKQHVPFATWIYLLVS